MAYRVVWSARALADTDAIASYIAADSSSYASTVVRKILSQTRVLADFPLAGRTVPEFGDENLREVFAYSYRIIYQVGQAEIVVVAIIHGKRTLQD
jgi:plasmid stabilization system protein ParE